MANKAELQKQIEYYLSDKNLVRDQFFNEKISEDKNGWLDLSFILTCNKIKQMKLVNGIDDLVAAIAGSKEVEVDVDKKKIRRVGGKTIPRLSFATKKRNFKAAEKQQQVPKVCEKNNFIQSNLNFENPVIVHFKTQETKENSFKVNWKDVKQAVGKNFPKLNVIYSRADKYEGDLAISSYKLNNSELEELISATLKIQNHYFTFSKTIGEELEAFWQKLTRHYQFCIKNIKKQQKFVTCDRSDDKGSKRAKSSYEIAGIYYSDINKVKTKARAILNLKKDGEKITGNDADFIKNLLQMHEKAAEKLNDFDHFVVGEHLEYANT